MAWWYGRRQRRRLASRRRVRRSVRERARAASEPRGNVMWRRQRSPAASLRPRRLQCHGVGCGVSERAKVRTEWRALAQLLVAAKRPIRTNFAAPAAQKIDGNGDGEITGSAKLAIRRPLDAANVPVRP